MDIMILSKIIPLCKPGATVRLVDDFIRVNGIDVGTVERASDGFVLWLFDRKPLAFIN